MMDISNKILEENEWEAEIPKRYLRLKDLINSRLKSHGQYPLTHLNSTYLHIWAIKCSSPQDFKSIAKDLDEEYFRVSLLKDDEFLYEFRHHPTPDDGDWYEYAFEIGYDDSDDWQTKYI